MNKININDIVLSVVFAFCLYYTSAHLYERFTDVHWWYNTSASAWSNGQCPAHPEMKWDWLRAEIILQSVNDDEKCEPYPHWDWTLSE